MTTAAEIVAAARSMIGTPFVHQGRLPGAGLDCLGVAVCAAARCGVVLRDVTTYRRSPRPAQLLAELDAQLARVPVEEARPGDVAVFWVQRPGREQHVGVLVERPGGLGVVHALCDLGRCAEHGLAGFWRERLCRVYRFAGTEP